MKTVRPSNLHRFFRNVIASTVLTASTIWIPAQQAGTSPVKIFILAGQSNMLGHGNVSPSTTTGTLEYVVANDPGNDYPFLIDGLSNWVVRSDVWIKDQDPSHGELTVGYGSSATTIGPELGFGHHLGDLYEKQVLIVKAAWGGKSLAVDFRPPSSGGTTGFYYNEILQLLNDAVTNLSSYFPDYEVTGGYEIAGFGWHQGWNDRVNGSHSAEYEANMANFIRDIRTDLDVPGLPFVIASTGMGGGMSYTEVELAQLGMADTNTYPEFAGNVAVIDTRIPYDGKDFWQPVEWSPANQNYHWNRNAKTYLHIGLAMADAMSTLAPARCPSRLRAMAGAPNGVALNWQNGNETPTNVQVMRNAVEIAAADPPTFLDSGAQPGIIEYELFFTMPSNACGSLTVTFDGGITDLKAFRDPGGIGLNWMNNMTYTAIEIRRDGMLLEASYSGVATAYIDASPPATGLVTYTVVPVNGNAAPTAAQINLDGPSGGNALIYEPFDYAIGGLNLKSGNAEVGLEGAWSAQATTLVTAGSLTFGDLPVGGGKISDFTGGQNRFGGSRAIRAEALANNGLLNDGAILWFSLLMGYDVGGNLTNTRLAFALANNSFNGGNYNYWIDDDGPQLGSGIGVTLGRLNGANGRTMATQFRDLASGDGLSGNVVGGFSGTNMGEGEHRLIVGRIVWGATNDTIEIYQPSTNLTLPDSPVSALTVSVDQVTFDTITFCRGDKSVMDEIRFGSAYEDVVGAGIGVPIDPPVIRFDIIDPNTALLSWDGVAGRTYDVMAATNLTSSWVLVASNLPAVVPITSYALDMTGQTRRYFRVGARP